MIRIIISDCDGVLTDGKLYYGADGEAIKVFNVKDGTAIKQLISNGIRFGVVSGRDSAALLKRSDELGFDFCLMGIDDKATVIQDLKSTYGFSKEEVLYIGDDINDCSARNEVGIFCAVADADKKVLDIADIVLRTNGGNGVIKEVIDIVL